MCPKDMTTMVTILQSNQSDLMLISNTMYKVFVVGLLTLCLDAIVWVLVVLTHCNHAYVLTPNVF